MVTWKSVIWSDENKHCEFSNSGCYFCMEKDWWKLRVWMFAGDCVTLWIGSYGLGCNLVWRSIPSYLYRKASKWWRIQQCSWKWTSTTLWRELRRAILSFKKTVLHVTHEGFQRFRKHEMESLEWVTLPLDLNPIEHVWKHLDRKIRIRKCKTKNIDDLQKFFWKGGIK